MMEAEKGDIVLIVEIETEDLGTGPCSNYSFLRIVGSSFDSVVAFASDRKRL